MSHIDVTAGIIERDGKILLARKKSGNTKGLWEFPGGKIEKNETPEMCLERELWEEFNIKVNIGDFIAESLYDYGEKQIRLLAFKVEYISGDFTLTDHDKIEWSLPKNLIKYKLSPADIPIVEKLLHI